MEGAMEVLAPAGTVDSLKAALSAGADAVYLAGKRFGARHFAANFSDAELAGAIALSHSRSAKVYVTVNTLIKEAEMREALDFVARLEKMKADAVIVQDRGLLSLVKENLGIAVHASTQMGIHTSDGAIWAREHGVERAILARELSLKQIGDVKRESGIGVEVFVHGALCICFSGQCLFSSFAGGRSGNRGMCAQPCRKQYSQSHSIGFLLSTADLCGIDAIPQLIGIGVDALKIEGRVRNPIYVHLVTKLYKQAVRRAEAGEEELLTAKEKGLLAVAFSRGFTGGHLLGEHIGHPEYADSRGLFIERVRSSNNHLMLKDATLGIGDGLTIYRDGEKIGGFEIKQQMSPFGHRVPFTIENGEYEIYKTKDASYSSIEAVIRSIPFRIGAVPRVDVRIPSIESKRRSHPPELSAYVSSLKTMEAILPHVDRVYFELSNDWEEAKTISKAAGVEFIVLMPRVSAKIPEIKAPQLMVCNVDQAHRYDAMRLFGHYSMNVLNSYCQPELFQSTLSLELSRQEIHELAARFAGRIEIMAFGRMELMVIKDAAIADGRLIDEAGRRFPVYQDSFGYSHILNNADLFLLEYMSEFERIGIDSIGLDLRRKNPDLATIVAKAFKERDESKKSIIKRKCGAITHGHFLKGVA
jgi:putative protease